MFLKNKFKENFIIRQGFANNVKGWGKITSQWVGNGKFCFGGVYLLGSWNLRRSAFDHLKLFQS